MPCLDLDWARPAIDACRFDEAGHLMVVDNSVTNRGIMRATNMGLDAMTDEDWFVIMSSSLVFGPAGGLDFVERLAELPPEHGIANGVPTWGWHLVAFRRNVVERMGRWDENFTPYGLDDVDLSIRITKSMPDVAWGGVPIEADDRVMGWSMKSGKVDAPYAPIHAYFMAKWGCDVGHEFEEYNDHPFGLVDSSINYWPSINGAQWNRRLDRDDA